ncbi:MAG: helix-turn-helix transcriptional regulator [Chloroflexota bacterium]|nr:helix-turn-helix transcriptional regulator [Chloroflexota bacterium]PLS78872.1 MAG: XRE family transcriptional regulator [Chloroflexota bacterium]
MKVVTSKMKLLVAQRELHERRRLSVRILTEESGASRSTVERLLNNTIKRIPVDDLGALCRYFNCTVGDMLQMEEDMNHT